MTKKIKNRSDSRTQEPRGGDIEQGGLAGLIAPVILVMIFFLAFIPRYEAVQAPKIRSFDEGLYNYLGTQLKYQPFNYSSSGFYELAGKRIAHPVERERVKAYVDVPLFKHPPLFCYLVAVSKWIFGDGYIGANYVSLFSGMATIFVVFLLCRYLWGELCGLLAAFFMAIEPVYWLCSMKIWIETTLGFFIYLGLLLLYLGRKHRIFYVLSGVSFGAALLLKYPAIVAIMAVFFVLVFTRDIIADKKMLFAYFTIPFITASPWLIWNYVVYRGGIFREMVAVHANPLQKGHFEYIRKFIIAGLLMGLAGGGLFIFRFIFNGLYNKAAEICTKSLHNKVTRAVFTVALTAPVIILLYLSREHIFKAFGWGYLPKTMNMMDPFHGSPKYFYFYHFVKLAPMFIFSYFSVFLLRRWNEWSYIFAMIVIAMFTFFGQYGAYESRYVIIATPALVMLAAFTVAETVSWLRGQQGLKRMILLPLFLSFVAYAVLKTLYFDFAVVAKNDFFFF